MALERRKCSLSPLGGGEGPGWAAGAQGDPKPPQRAVSGSGRGCSPGWVILEPPGCPRSSSLPALPEECALSWGWPVRRKESYVWSADEVILSGNHWKHSPLQPSSFSQETTLGGEAKTASCLTFLDFFFPLESLGLLFCASHSHWACIFPTHGGVPGLLFPRGIAIIWIKK